MNKCFLYKKKYVASVRFTLEIENHVCMCVFIVYFTYTGMLIVGIKAQFCTQRNVFIDKLAFRITV